MKWLVLAVWVAIQIIVPTMISIELYATAIQLELAFFACAIWYFNKVYSKDDLNSILSVFAIYYGYIYATDSFITSMPNSAIFLEAMIVYIILVIKMDKD